MIQSFGRSYRHSKTWRGNFSHLGLQSVCREAAPAFHRRFLFLMVSHPEYCLPMSGLLPGASPSCFRLSFYFIWKSQISNSLHPPEQTPDVLKIYILKKFVGLKIWKITYILFGEGCTLNSMQK